MTVTSPYFSFLTARRLMISSAVAATAVLSACTTNDDYLKASTLPPITVSEELDKGTLGEIYRVPEGDGRIATGELKKPLPPTLSGLQGVSEPRVQTFEGDSWLVVPKEASATWSQLLIFLRSRSISTVSQDVFKATIETGWVRDESDPTQAYRYRLHLEAGLQSDLTEIHAVNIQGSPRSQLPAVSQWPPQPESATQQTKFLKQIAKVMSNQKALGDSLIASSINLPEKVRGSSVQGEPVIELAISPARTWQAVETALGQGDFVLYDQDRSAGVFYMDEDEKTAKKKKSLKEKVGAFLDELARVEITKRGASKEKGKVSPYSLEQVLAHLPEDDVVNALLGPIENSDKPLLNKVPGYLLVVNNIGDKQRLYVRDGYGRPLPSAQAKLLLDSVKSQLF